LLNKSALQMSRTNSTGLSKIDQFEKIEKIEKTEKIEKIEKIEFLISGRASSSSGKNRRTKEFFHTFIALYRREEADRDLQRSSVKES
jgi:hypothetical protein